MIFVRMPELAADNEQPVQLFCNGKSESDYPENRKCSENRNKHISMTPLNECARGE